MQIAHLLVKSTAAGLSSRNLAHVRALAGLKDRLGERLWMLERGFSYLELLLNLVDEG